jgi:hypothetical protein
MSAGPPTASPHTEAPNTAAQRRAEALRRAARGKREAATTRTEAAIRQLVKTKQEITFRAVARAAGVSLDFLYANTDLRGRIQTLRAQQSAPPPAASTGPAPADNDSTVVRVLAARLREERNTHQAAVRDLEQRLAAAHGEMLRLRRMLRQHGIET